MNPTPLPAPPSLPTIRPSADEDPMRLMRELRGMLTNMGEVIARLETSLMCHELAILTVEHKENTALAICDDLRLRVLKLEEAQAAE